MRCSTKGENVNVLFLSLVLINSIEEKGIYTDLLREFRNNGHNVYVISPHERRLKLPTEYVEKDGVYYLKVRTGNITKVNVVEKGLSTLLIERLFIKAVQKYLNQVRFDLIIYATPPITSEKVVRYIKNKDTAKTYLLLKDIFPQNAVDLGMLSKRSLLYKYFRQKEKRLYKSADYIGCMSQANVDFLLRHNPDIPPDVVEVCPNSIEVSNIDIGLDMLRQIRDRYGLPHDKTIFLYGGNLGKPQGIDFLIKCLRSNRLNDQVFFVIAGSGTEFPKLQDYFDTENPKNAKLVNQLPRNDYELLANACDVGLIFLDRRFTIPNFPSRLLSYMQASIPVLAATDINTDIGKIIEEGNFGYWCESGDINKFNEHLVKLCDENERKKLGANARRYLEEHYTVRRSYEIIMKHFG